MLNKWRKINSFEPIEFKKYIKEYDPLTGKKLEWKIINDPNMGIYIGQILNGSRHGVGRLILSEPKDTRNTLAEGQFKNNCLNGYGRMIYGNGSYYQGQFLNN